MRRLIFATLALAALCGEASAERWLRIDPNDPYGNEGSFHWFDIDTAYEDGVTGWVYAWGTYKKAADLGAAGQNGFLWAFDCTANTVHFVGSRENGVWKETAGWRDKSDDLGKPHMGGVTNSWASRLCALKGSWPKRPIGP